MMLVCKAEHLFKIPSDVAIFQSSHQKCLNDQTRKRFSAFQIERGTIGIGIFDVTTGICKGLEILPFIFYPHDLLVTRHERFPLI